MPSPVSVALCTYNGARFLEQQLLSILAQTRLPKEIVLSDDASTDDTVAIARRVLAGSPVALVVLQNPTSLGVTRNFEQAIRATTGQLVALCDQDDIWHPERISRLASALEKPALEKPGLLLVHSDARLVDETGAPTGVTLLQALEVSQGEREKIHLGEGFAVLLHRNVVTGATTMFRRELLQAAAPFPPAWVHDEWLAAIAGAVGRFDLVEQQLTDYRQHGGNQIGAAELSLRAKLSRLTEPREARNRRLVDRAEALAVRLSGQPEVTDEMRSLAWGKLDHERHRLGLPPARLRRVAPALREWRAGGYRVYGRGAADLLRDLVQPAR